MVNLQFYMQKLNYYDFGEKIEGFIFCETPAKMDKMNIKFYPEPITRYLYYLAKIHHEMMILLPQSIWKNHLHIIQDVLAICCIFL